MSDEQQRLQQELTQLEGAIAGLAGLPDAQKSLQAQIDAKRKDLAKLTGEPSPTVGNQTTIQGDVTGSVFSGSFSGPVTLGPQISGPIQAGRDVNVATKQTITNSDSRSGTFVEGDQYNMSGDFSAAILNIKSTLSNVTQSIGAASQLSTQDADQLKALVEQLSAELQKHAAQYPKETAEVTKRTESAVTEATKSEPDQGDVSYSLDRLKQAATNIAALVPAVLPIATQIADTIRKIAGM